MMRNPSGEMCLEPRQDDDSITKKYHLEGPYKHQLGWRPTTNIYDAWTPRLWLVYQSSLCDKTKKRMVFVP